jgi:hypothetical protein
MGRTCSTHGREMKYIQIFIPKSCRENHLGDLLIDNIKMDIRKMEC